MGKLDQRAEKLDKRQAELDKRAGELDKRKQKLDEREKKISTAEQEYAEGTIPDDGVYVVGEDIEPGTYSTDGGANCYWARLASTSGGDIITNGVPGGPTTMTISPSDTAFKTGRCGE